ncbi:glycogen operon protein GlgX [Amycolatopsis sp. MEPSY49]|uniref:glycogen operon protein GlgX n=1 Tax=Amycolatopsis sp. MEPSY49 TaxID=3151600 RepID=UPI003EF58FCD
MTLDQQVQPSESGTRPDPVPERCELRYDQLFGWSVRRRGVQSFLALERGICAVTLPKLSAGPVIARLAANGCAGPALVIPMRRGPHVALLAEVDGLIPSRSELPEDAEVLAWGALLPLPDRARRDAAAEWLIAPDPRQRWLPSLDAVLAGISARR